MCKNILVTNIQRCCMHDGPGIRTTIFLKGCSVRCPWCSNPENWNMYPEEYCKDGLKGVYGEYLSCDDIYQIIIKDKIFYESGGGVTYSGGEALLQIDCLEPLLQRMKNEHIHQCIETALFVTLDKLQIAIKYIDLFYVDIKLLDPSKCKNRIQGDLNQYFNNVDELFRRRIPVVFRIPLIEGNTSDADNRNRILNFLKEYKPERVEIIQGHNLGNNKYITLGMEAPQIQGTRDSVMLSMCKDIAKLGIKTQICEI